MTRPISRRTFVRRAAIASAASALPFSTIASSFTSNAAPSAGSLVMIELPGPTLDDVSRNLIRRHGIRGVVLFQKNIVNSRQVRQLNEAIRDLIGPSALIAVDQEGGGVVRTLDFPFPPSAMSLGASGDEELAEEVGAATGRALASLGFNWNFAPVLDVNNNPLNPVIGDRSFGSDPFMVGRLGMAWARGCQSAGVATCVKHFPGHGDTHEDSHLLMPVVEKSREELLDVELRPFQYAVQMGVPCFMTSHILYRDLDPEYPATLSRKILTGILRDSWGYDGVIVTDSMSMRAISRNYNRADATRLSLEAGADMIMAMGRPRDVEQTLAAISSSLDAGRISEEDFYRRAGRLDRLAAGYPSSTGSYSAVSKSRDAAVLSEAWGRGLTPYKDPQRPLPGSRVTLIVAGQTGSGGATTRGLSGPALADLLSTRYNLSTIFYDRRRPLRAMEAIRENRHENRFTIFASTGRLRPDAELKQLIRGARPDLHLALWNPYTVLDVEAPALISYGFRPEALERVAAWLEGTQIADGTLPIELRPDGSFGRIGTEG